MNSSAKTTTFSFLAAAALGAAVFMGCTVTSGTVDDTDGGTQDNDKDGGSNSDTGTPDSGGGETCSNTHQTNMFEPAACQSCMESKCCLELDNCFKIPSDEASGKFGCNDFKLCLDDCVKPNEDGTEKTEDEINECYTGCADTLAAEGVVTAWQSVTACAEQSCATECAE